MTRPGLASDQRPAPPYQSPCFGSVMRDTLPKKMMAEAMHQTEVFVVVEVQEVLDAEALAAYQSAARQQLRERGGVVVARGNALFEGGPVVDQMLVQRWPSEAAFRHWQDSEAYRPLLEQRRKCVKLRIIILQCA